MLFNVLETLEKGEVHLGIAQLVQCMKSLHEFATNRTWKTAWPLTHMVDLLRSHIHGGNEVEMETVLEYVRTQDDLRKKVLSGGQFCQQEDTLDEEAEAEAQPRPPRPR